MLSHMPGKLVLERLLRLCEQLYSLKYGNENLKNHTERRRGD